MIDKAFMDLRDPFGSVGLGVPLFSCAMSDPTRVGDAAKARQYAAIAEAGKPPTPPCTDFKNGPNPKFETEILGYIQYVWGNMRP